MDRQRFCSVVFVTQAKPEVPHPHGAPPESCSSRDKWPWSCSKWDTGIVPGDTRTAGTKIRFASLPLGHRESRHWFEIK